MTRITLDAEHRGRTVSISVEEELDTEEVRTFDVSVDFDLEPGISALIDAGSAALKAALR